MLVVVIVLVHHCAGIEEVLSGAVDSDIHLLADVIKSFDTVNRSVLDRVLSSFGLSA